MLKRFFPYKKIKSLYDIDFEDLYDSGVRGLTFDIDNTLVPDSAPADEKTVGLFKRLKKIGFKCCIISNNGKKRVRPFAEKAGVKYLYKTAKPSRKGFLKAMKITGSAPENTVHFGDQLFTDMWGANKVGIRSYLVEPIDRTREPFQIRLKRILEKIVFLFYRGKNS
ncbi:MAG: YqeG family HAD IIIA-type phosphatase [Lachnospiraceae bacterium]|nr:YqeG family HAD IIIA-type phosphatase [Lachnospiraceae bacterium]MBR6270689.1 YqeG family HAD IIIA-type phosphatase [Lachnospiraceae bacterium]